MKKATKYAIAEMNQNDGTQTIVFHGLPKWRAQAIAGDMKRLGAKKVQIIKDTYSE